MDFLRLLESIRIPGLNELMLLITRLGEETAFLVIALAFFWCIDKKRGYYILCVGFIGTILNQFMKLWFRVPRPWVLDKDFTILEQAREAASGYSFPSGHSQNAVGTFGAIGYTTKNKLVRIGCISVAVLVPFSRMYIGVHTPMDVLVAAAMAVVLIFLLRPIVLDNDGKYIPALLGIMTMLAIAYLCFVEFYPFPENMDAHNLASGTENAYTLFGALLGLLIVYYVDENYLQFNTKAVWWAQIGKVIGGLAVVLAVKSGTKGVLNALLGANSGRAARYFLVVIVAGIVWPLTFKFFAKLGSKE